MRNTWALMAVRLVGKERKSDGVSALASVYDLCDYAAVPETVFYG